MLQHTGTKPLTFDKEHKKQIFDLASHFCQMSACSVVVVGGGGCGGAGGVRVPPCIIVSMTEMLKLLQDGR